MIGTQSNFQIYCEEMDQITRPNFTKVLCDEQLFELDVSVPGLPELLLHGLNVPRCLDKVPLGLLLVLLMELLGKGQKEQLVQRDNLNT